MIRDIIRIPGRMAPVIFNVAPHPDPFNIPPVSIGPYEKVITTSMSNGQLLERIFIKPESGDGGLYPVTIKLLYPEPMYTQGVIGGREITYGYYVKGIEALYRHWLGIMEPSLNTTFISIAHLIKCLVSLASDQQRPINKLRLIERAIRTTCGSGVSPAEPASMELMMELLYGCEHMGHDTPSSILGYLFHNLSMENSSSTIDSILTALYEDLDGMMMPIEATDNISRELAYTSAEYGMLVLTEERLARLSNNPGRCADAEMYIDVTTPQRIVNPTTTMSSIHMVTNTGSVFLFEVIQELAAVPADYRDLQLGVNSAGNIYKINRPIRPDVGAANDRTTKILYDLVRLMASICFDIGATDVYLERYLSEDAYIAVTLSTGVVAEMYIDLPLWACSGQVLPTQAVLDQTSV